MHVDEKAGRWLGEWERVLAAVCKSRCKAGASDGISGGVFKAEIGVEEEGSGSTEERNDKIGQAVVVDVADSHSSPCSRGRGIIRCVKRERECRAGGGVHDGGACKDK